MEILCPFVPTFLAHAARTPGADAVVTPEGRTSYHHLAGLAGAMQRALRRTGSPEGPVAILSTDVVRRAAGILAAAACGRAVVLMDPARDPDALAAAAATIGARTAIGEDPPDVFTGRIVTDGLAAGALEPTPVTASTPFAYVSTSGSTGDPRYVLRTHAAAGSAVGARVPYGTADRVFRPFNHSSAGMSEIVDALLAGSALLSLDPLRIPPSLTVGFLQDERVTVVNATPSVLRLMFRTARGGGDVPLPALRSVGGGGEPLGWSDVALLRALGPMTCIVRHGYGASETRSITSRHIRADEPLGDGTVPVGSPVPGRRVWIDAGEGRPAPAGVAGTIVVEGRFGTVGPTFEHLPDGWLRFRSGDVGEMTVDGELVHRGRSDGVVKVGAVRIDPAAVEDVLRVAPGVRDVRVVPTPVGAGEVRLVAHVVLSGAATVRDVDLRAFAAARLTSNAVPARFILHDNPFPLLASGKTDVRALTAHRGGS